MIKENAKVISVLLVIALAYIYAYYWVDEEERSILFFILWVVAIYGLIAYAAYKFCYTTLKLLFVDEEERGWQDDKPKAGAGEQKKVEGGADGFDENMTPAPALPAFHGHDDDFYDYF